MVLDVTWRFPARMLSRLLCESSELVRSCCVVLEVLGVGEETEGGVVAVVVVAGVLGACVGSRDGCAAACTEACVVAGAGEGCEDDVNVAFKRVWNCPLVVPRKT